MSGDTKPVTPLLVLIAGAFLVAVYGIIIAVWAEQPGWHTPVVVGSSIAAAAAALLYNQHGVLLDLAHHPGSVVFQYMIYALLGVVIDIVGQYILGWWGYPDLPLPLQIFHVYLLGYPFSFFFAFELYLIGLAAVRSAWGSLLIATLVSVAIHELPNVSAKQWVYQFPGADVMLAGVPVMIVGWWFLAVLIPIFIREQLRIPTSFPYRWFTMFSHSADEK